MNIHLPGQDQQIMQQAAMADQRQQAAAQMVNIVRQQMLTTTFVQLSIDHKVSKEPLTLEEGRALAGMATEVTDGYIGFLLESLGLAEMKKLDSE